MSFIVETSRNGKPHIIYKNYKYREGYSKKSGDIMWRCLGRTCAATLKTDAGKTTVTSSGKHTGQHPVTMRSLSSPQPSRNTSVSSPARTAATAAAATPPQLTHDSPAATPQTPPPSCSTLDTSLSLATPDVTDLVTENSELRSEVIELNKRLKCVLDHSIESDTRLMHFTNEIFAANSSQCDTSTRTSVADCGVQCELLTTCKVCTESKEIITSLRTTIEVLQADLRCLREESKNCGCRQGGGVSDWTVVPGKRTSPVVTTNRFTLLSNLQQDEQKSVVEEKIRPKRTHNRKITNKRPPRPPSRPKAMASIQRNNKKVSLNFKHVHIEGDSHSRDIAGLVRAMVTEGTAVEGVCKPGAKLLSATTDGACQPGSCHVIIAGTNDLARGQQRNLYQHLERRITARLKSAKVAVSTLPHRHDLPVNHPINQETTLMNFYIEELCVRHAGVDVIDFNQINRNAFNNHGMHLKPQSKHLLAELVVSCLQRLDTVDAVPPQQPRLPLPRDPGPETAERAATINHPPPTTSTPSPPASPRTVMLPHESYADAVKLPSPKPHFLEDNVLMVGLD